MTTGEVLRMRDEATVLETIDIGRLLALYEPAFIVNGVCVFA